MLWELRQTPGSAFQHLRLSTRQLQDTRSLYRPSLQPIYPIPFTSDATQPDRIRLAPFAPTAIQPTSHPPVYQACPLQPRDQVSNCSTILDTVVDLKIDFRFIFFKAKSTVCIESGYLPAQYTLLLLTYLVLLVASFLYYFPFYGKFYSV